MIIKSRFKKILIESISASFDPKLINHLGREVESGFDLKKISGLSYGLTLQPLDASKIIVDYFLKKNQAKQLIRELLNAVYHGLNGRTISMSTINKILIELEKINYYYDKKQKLIIDKSGNQSNDWGFLEENNEYSFCFASIDVVKNSVITRLNKSNTVSSIYKQLHSLVENKVHQRNGRVWNWEGDGGIIAFYGENAVERTTIAMFDSILSMPVFNAIQNKLYFEIKIRIAIHPGKAVYKKNIKTIKSEALKTTQMLEKKYTPPGSLCISNVGWKSLDSNFQSLFGKEIILKTIGFHLLNLSLGKVTNE